MRARRMCEHRRLLHLSVSCWIPVDLNQNRVPRLHIYIHATYAHFKSMCVVCVVCMFIVLSVSFFPARSGRVCGQWSYLQQWPLCEHWRQLPLCLQCWIWNFSRWQKLSRSVNFSCWSLTTLWSKDSFSIYDKWTMDMLEVVEAWTIMGEIMHNHWK